MSSMKKSVDMIEKTGIMKDSKLNQLEELVSMLNYNL